MALYAIIWKAQYEVIYDFERTFYISNACHIALGIALSNSEWDG